MTVKMSLIGIIMTGRTMIALEAGSQSHIISRYAVKVRQFWILFLVMESTFDGKAFEFWIASGCVEAKHVKCWMCFLDDDLWINCKGHCLQNKKWSHSNKWIYVWRIIYIQSAMIGKARVIKLREVNLVKQESLSLNKAKINDKVTKHDF